MYIYIYIYICIYVGYMSKVCVWGRGGGGGDSLNLHHNSCYFIGFISFLKIYCPLGDLLGTENSLLFIGFIRYLSFRVVNISDG